MTTWHAMSQRHPPAPGKYWTRTIRSRIYLPHGKTTTYYDTARRYWTGEEWQDGAEVEGWMEITQ